MEYSSTDLERKFPLTTTPAGTHWIEKSESHDEGFPAKRQGIPPALRFQPRPWRMHAQGDDVTWTREAPTMKVRGWDGYMYEAVWLHTSEAEKRGIKNGDIVKVFNERGIVSAARMFPSA